MRARVLAAALVAVVACRSTTSGGDEDVAPGPTPGGPVALEGTRWIPTELANRPVPPPAPGASPAYLQFDSTTRRVSASAGCNGMSGEYELNGESLRVGQVASTLMMCADSGVMEREGIMGRLFEQVDRWRIVGGTLELLDDGTVLGRFRPAGDAETGAAPSAPNAPAGIEDVTWRLASLGGADPDGEPPYFRLTPAGAGGEVRGDGGCNNFRGPYERDGQSIRMGPLVSTRRACAEASRNAQESALLDALGAARRWRVENGVLVLHGDAGELARFRAEGR